MKYYLAIDIGSTSGRHMVGWLEDGEIRQDEVYRFANGTINEDGHMMWDLNRLFNEVLNGIRTAFSKYPRIESLSVDTWGADYVLMKDDQEILPSYCYRDDRTVLAMEKVHEIIPFETIYSKAGYQMARFNTIYQLYDDKLHGRLDQATDFLLMPEYLMYKLCGVKSKEATNCSTTSLVNAYTGEFDMDLTRALGFSDDLFPKLSPPGTVLGPLLPEVASAVGGTCQVVLCASHDTESAILALPMEDDQIYISSGTWSLLGIRIREPITTMEGANAGFSNEGGLDYICYLTNIVGMWIVEQLRKELCPGEKYSVIVQQAQESGYKYLIDPNHPSFTAPSSMCEAIRSDLIRQGKPAPVTTGDYFSCAYHSLAANYHQFISVLEDVTKVSYQKIYITGGGARNDFLNRLTEEYTGKKVIPYPIEASTAGSIMVQMNIFKEKEQC